MNIENFSLIVVLGLIALTVIIIYRLINRGGKGNNNLNPLDEAEVYIAFGRNKKAKKILEKYLFNNPSNKRALSLLSRLK